MIWVYLGKKNVGLNHIEIVAVGDDNNSILSTYYVNSVTATFEFETVRLNTPQNLTVTQIDGTNGGSKQFKIQWNEVQNCVGYKVIIGGVEKPLTTETTYTIESTAGTHSFKVKAVGDGCGYIDSVESSAKTVTVLSAPTVSIHPENIKNTKFYVRWNTGEDISAFYLVITKENLSTGEKTTVHQQIYSHGSSSTSVFVVENGCKYTAEIYAIGDGVNSFDSPKVTAIKIFA